MTVYFERDRGKWRYDFRHKGKRYQGYCLDAGGDPVTSRSAAIQAEGVEKRRAAIAPKLPTAKGMTLAQAFAALAPEFDKLKDRDNKYRAMAEIVGFFGLDCAMASIDEARIRAYVTFSLSQPVRHWVGGPRKAATVTRPDACRTAPRTRSVSTANIYLHVLRQALTLASQTRDPLTREPAIGKPPHVPVLKGPKRRARPVPEDVLLELRTLLPPHVLDAFDLTLHFGFRRGEAFGLTASQIAWDERGVRLYAENVKDAEDAFLPAPDATMDLLRRLADQARERGVRHLVTYLPPGENAKWRPIKSPKRAWRTAMKTIREKFGAQWRWHDLRAAYITLAAMRASPAAVQELARHSSFSTTKRYIDVADEARRTAAERAVDRPALKAVK